MTRYLVEMETIGREVYSVEADSPEEARELWAVGLLVVSETVSVEDVTSVRSEDE